MGQIRLEGMEFFARHGCTRKEQEKGNTFIVDLIIGEDLTVAGKSDDLNDAIDYTEVYNLIKQEMKIRSNLLEHVGMRILDAVSDHFEGLSEITVKISKPDPPVDGKTNSFSVVMTRRLHG
ncbi:MAG: dihydroneopterin aldolase [Bacteroidetes bacterium]|nr:dihydroneopterin aldolase [Bacteroidota bacterium]